MGFKFFGSGVGVYQSLVVQLLLWTVYKIVQGVLALYMWIEHVCICCVDSMWCIASREEVGVVATG